MLGTLLIAAIVIDVKARRRRRIRGDGGAVHRARWTTRAGSTGTRPAAATTPSAAGSDSPAISQIAAARGQAGNGAARAPQMRRPGRATYAARRSH
jgi:hypothetical protein